MSNQLKGFAANPELARILGAKGGRAGRGGHKSPNLDILKSLKPGDSKVFEEPQRVVMNRFYNVARRNDMRISVTQHGSGSKLWRNS